MMGWLGVVLVAIGGAAGAVARFWVHHLLRSRFGATSAASTLIVNVSGAFTLGLMTSTATYAGTWALAGVGFCGAFTTFSTLALDLWAAFDQGRRRAAMANIVLSLVLGLGAAWVGISLAGP